MIVNSDYVTVEKTTKTPANVRDRRRRRSSSSNTFAATLVFITHRACRWRKYGLCEKEETSERLFKNLIRRSSSSRFEDRSAWSDRWCMSVWIALFLLIPDRVNFVVSPGSVNVAKTRTNALRCESSCAFSPRRKRRHVFWLIFHSDIISIQTVKELRST